MNDNNRQYVYIERGRALVAAAQRVSDLLTDRVVLGSHKGLRQAVTDAEACLDTIRRQVDDVLTKTSVGTADPDDALDNRV